MTKAKDDVKNKYMWIILLLSIILGLGAAVLSKRIGFLPLAGAVAVFWISYSTLWDKYKKSDHYRNRYGGS